MATVIVDCLHEVNDIEGWPSSRLSCVASLEMGQRAKRAGENLVPGPSPARITRWRISREFAPAAAHERLLTDYLGLVCERRSITATSWQPEIRLRSQANLGLNRRASRKSQLSLYLLIGLFLLEVRLTIVDYGLTSLQSGSFVK